MLYERYALKLLSYAIKSWQLNEDEAWDIIYKIMFKIVDKIKDYNFKTEKGFANLIYTSFNRELINYYHKKKKLEERFNLLFMEDETIENAEQSEVLLNEIDKEYLAESLKGFWEEPEKENKLLDLLSKVLDEMEEWERILLLQKSSGFTYKEIAQYIDKPEKNLKVYYQRLKANIHKKLIGYVKNNYVDAK